MMHHRPQASEFSRHTLIFVCITSNVIHTTIKPHTPFSYLLPSHCNVRIEIWCKFKQANLLTHPCLCVSGQVSAQGAAVQVPAPATASPRAAAAERPQQPDPEEPAAPGSTAGRPQPGPHIWPHSHGESVILPPHIRPHSHGESVILPPSTRASYQASFPW